MTIFELTDEPYAEQHWTTSECSHGCHDLKPTESDKNWWQLSIEDGRANVECATCKCTYDPLMWDGAEALYTAEPIPVKVTFDYCSQSYHGDHQCDCGWSVVLNPRQEN